MNRIKYCIIFIILIITGCSSSILVNNKDFFYMDTYINIKIYSNNKQLVDNVYEEIDNIYHEYHNLTDRYHEYDNLVNIYYINNKLELNKPIEIDKRLYNLIKYGKEFYEESNGLVNIALGNVIDIWKSYRDNNNGIPTEEELINSNNISINDIELLNNNQIIKKSNISLDLGAIAKGYVTEIVGQYLEEKGLNKYLINAGGNVKVGDHYQDNKYKIGIENPLNGVDIYKVIKGNNIAVVTSGGYERFYEYNNQRYHHIIDPNTLFPPNYMLSVTVICYDSALGDSLSTMLFLMPIEEGIDYINSLDKVEAIWFDLDEQIHYSKGFDQYE